MAGLNFTERQAFIFEKRPLKYFRWMYPPALWKFETHIDRRKRLKCSHGIEYIMDHESGEERYDGIIRHCEEKFIR